MNKNQNTHKIILTIALLLALPAAHLLAGSANVSAASQTNGFHRSMNPIHRLLFPASTYMIDDGTAEDAVGFSTTGTRNDEAIWFNQFDVIPGQETIASVSIAWGTPLFPEEINGTQIIIAIWSDPNGDGDPRDAILLGSTKGTIVNGGTDTFVTYPFSPPIALPAGATSFFVGDVTPANEGPEHFYQAIDENSVLHRQSWVAGRSDGGPVNINRIDDNDFVGIIDDFGLLGNWLVRADAGDGSQNKTLTAFIRRVQGETIVVLNWTPTGGGGVNITRNGGLIATADDDGSTQNNIKNFTGDVVYQVCNTTGGGCSNQVRLRINPHAD